jgi:uncharacterized protein involved in exopolysaccharide biosynthesis
MTSMPITRVCDADGVVNQDLIDLYDFFGAIRSRLLLICCISLACGAAMTALAFYLKPVYRGYAVLAPVTSENNPLTEAPTSSAAGGLISALKSGLSDADRETDEAMTVLGSREFTESFITDKNLLPVLFPKLWDAHKGRWKEGVRKVPTLARGFIAFDEIRKIDRDANNDFVTLQIDWPDRVKAAEWVNQLAQRLNDELRKRAIASADAALAYLQKELASTDDVSTREAISRLMEGQIKRKMLANVTQEFALRFVDEAIVPDADFPTRPKKLIMAGAGVVFGALIGVAVALLLYRRELSKKGLL